VLELPTGAKSIPYTDNTYFTDKTGTIYSFSRSYPNGKILKPSVGSSGYPSVNIVFKGRRRFITVHQLICRTFISVNYIEEGYCCLHADDNKLNYSLSNLSVGTYSQNNRDAYTRNLNTGNTLDLR